ncbi:MAG: hypothetical protein ABW061_19465 [Polyangiaceae bacterium]
MTRKPTLLGVRSRYSKCAWSLVLGLSVPALWLAGCSSDHNNGDTAGAAGTLSQAGQPGSNAGSSGVGVTPSPVVISAKTRAPITTTRSINYWMWSPTYGDDIAGTEAQVKPLGFELMRIGGYNNDANTPDPFDDAQTDDAVAYARAIGAEPILQVPLIADTVGLPPSATTAADMVSYANVTKGYGIKYFSIGNEPDLYDTQGSLTDSAAPAYPNYAPEDYCTTAKAYVAAMKSVDPTIQIVGPDLAYKYTAAQDWLSPVLQQCGDLFDVVAIHRYPFPAAMATLAAAKADVTQFENAVAAVRGLMSAAGYGDKPLAITEMNIDYDALPTQNAPAAVAGSVPAALWAMDILGASQELELRTTALWDTSDDEGYQLGLIGIPPAHTPRPAYYAYQLFAEHAGDTRLELTSAPADVHVYPTRNAAHDTTQAMVVNWNTAAQVLEFRVSDLDGASPAPVVFTVPGLSMAALDIPDVGDAKGEIYGYAEHAAASGPVPLAPGIGPLGDVDAGLPSEDLDAGGECAQVQLMTPDVTTLGRASGSTLTFGPSGSTWVSFGYAGDGEATPTGSVTADGNGFELKESLTPPLTANNYAGFGMYFNSGSCLDASQKTGIQFELSGDLGGCALRYILLFAQDLSHIDDPGRGHCQDTDAVCQGPSMTVQASASVVQIPFASLDNGAPVAVLDPKNLVTMQWELSASDPAAGCNADLTVQHVRFY